jgi:hypothetical protein
LVKSAGLVLKKIAFLVGDECHESREVVPCFEYHDSEDIKERYLDIDPGHDLAGCRVSRSCLLLEREAGSLVLGHLHKRS